jgi:hypothetical protein
MVRRWWFSGIAVLALVSVLWAKPGSVQTNDGQVFQGDVTEENGFVTITSHGISTKIDKRNVAKTQYTASLDDQYQQRHDKLAADDVVGRMDLGKWAMQNQRADLAVAVLEEARKIDPTNRDAAAQLLAAQSQLELDQHQGGAAGATTTPAVAPVQPSATGGTPKPTPAEYRLLTNDEVNIIRQKELQQGDNVQIRFENNVVKTYLTGTSVEDANTFRALSPVDQATQIISTNDPKLCNLVRIATDPPALLAFKQKINPLVATSCGSMACHGGGKNGGSFGLFPGDSNNAVYTNFYILQMYEQKVGQVKYKMLDRTVPERSLLLQFLVPANQSDITHPTIPDFRARFRAKTDPMYQSIMEWLNNSLKPIVPDYGINVSPNVPATQPSPDKLK